MGDTEEKLHVTGASSTPCFLFCKVHYIMLMDGEYSGVVFENFKKYLRLAEDNVERNARRSTEVKRNRRLKTFFVMRVQIAK